MDILGKVWIIFQILIGYNLVLPFILFIIWRFFKRTVHQTGSPEIIEGTNADYAVIVTAYEQVDSLPFAVASILASGYENYVVYIVADKCDISTLHFTDPRVVVLRPAETLASNTASHRYAFQHFRRPHEYVTIIDSDNLVHRDYFSQMNKAFRNNYKAVQGIRLPKNLNTAVARLDAARDLYYHFYDGTILYQLGSSATLSGSGMAFTTALYREFLDQHKVSGAGFDKVLQNFIVRQGIRIAFNEHAIVYDEKTSRETQLVNQRSRWINTWFKYFKLGFGLIYNGLTTLNVNKFLFGLTLLRPPLFIFLILSVCCLLINLLFSPVYSLIWFAALSIFVIGFMISLRYSKADDTIYQSLYNIPKFVFLQLKSLIKSRHASKHSVATEHYTADQSGIIKENNEDRS